MRDAHEVPYRCRVHAGGSKGAPGNARCPADPGNDDEGNGRPHAQGLGRDGPGSDHEDVDAELARGLGEDAEAVLEPVRRRRAPSRDGAQMTADATPPSSMASSTPELAHDRPYTPVHAP